METDSLLNGSLKGPVRTEAGQKDSGPWLIRAAARALSDGLLGRKVRPPPAQTPQALRAHLFRLKHQPVARFASAALLALGFFEPPYWCETKHACTNLWSEYPQAHMPYVTEAQALIWGFVCAMPLALDEVLRVRANGKKAFCDASSLQGIAVPLLLFATVLLGVLVVVLPNGVVQSLRLLPANHLLRVSFLILHDRELRAQLGVIVRLVPRFVRFLMLLLFVGFFYSLFGMSIFPERTSAEGAAYFSSIGEALWNFVLLLTSNNMPAIAVVAWGSSQLSALYILAAVFVAYFYFLNLVLAVVYDGYLDHKQEYLVATKLNYAGNLETAYTLLEQVSSYGDDSDHDQQGGSFTKQRGEGDSSSSSSTASSTCGNNDSCASTSSSSYQHSPQLGQVASGVDDAFAMAAAMNKRSHSEGVTYARVAELLQELESLNCCDGVTSMAKRQRAWQQVRDFHNFHNRYSSSSSSGDNSSSSTSGDNGSSPTRSRSNSRVIFDDDSEGSLVVDFIASKDPNAHVDRKTFATVCVLTQINFVKQRDNHRSDGGGSVLGGGTFLQRWAPEVAQSKGFRKLSTFVKSHAFANIFAAILVVNTALLLLEVQGEPLYDQTLAITSVFVVIYTVEFLLNLVVRGWAWFSVSIRRRVELAALLASAVLMIACYMTGADTDSNSTGRVRLVRLLLVMRCTPTIRLLAFVGDYSTFAKVTLALVPRAYEMVKVLFVAMYLFGVLGMLLYGGLISYTEPELDGTLYVEDSFEALNFNDLTSAMLLLLQVLVVNEFDVLVDGFVAVSSVWSRLYFLAFYLLGVLLILNIVIAVMIDAYLTSMHRQLKERGRRRAALAEANDLLDAKTAGAKGKVSKRDSSEGGGYDNDEDDDDDDDDGAHARRCQRCLCPACCCFVCKKTDCAPLPSPVNFEGMPAPVAVSEMLDAASAVGHYDGGTFEGSLLGLEGRYVASGYTQTSLVREALLNQSNAPMFGGLGPDRNPPASEPAPFFAASY